MHVSNNCKYKTKSAQLAQFHKTTNQFSILSKIKVNRKIGGSTKVEDWKLVFNST